MRLAAGDDPGALLAARRARKPPMPAPTGPALLALELMDPKLPERGRPLSSKYLEGNAKPGLKSAWLMPRTCWTCSATPKPRSLAGRDTRKARFPGRLAGSRLVAASGQPAARHKPRWSATSRWPSRRADRRRSQAWPGAGLPVFGADWPKSARTSPAAEAGWNKMKPC